MPLFLSWSFNFFSPIFNPQSDTSLPTNLQSKMGRKQKNKQGDPTPLSTFTSSSSKGKRKASDVELLKDGRGSSLKKAKPSANGDVSSKLKPLKDKKMKSTSSEKVKLKGKEKVSRPKTKAKKASTSDDDDLEGDNDDGWNGFGEDTGNEDDLAAHTKSVSIPILSSRILAEDFFSLPPPFRFLTLDFLY